MLLTKLNTINCEEIMTEPLKPIEFVVDNLISQGLFILAGAPKVGKSWLALDICLSKAKGEPVLNNKTTQGTALYLCLEDSRIRIQHRLYEMTDEPTEYLHFALIANSIGNGLEEQIENFISEHRDTKIIFIDTLQKIRSDSPESTYATDYRELSVLKTIADKYSIAISGPSSSQDKRHRSVQYDFGNNRYQRLRRRQLCSFGIKSQLSERNALLRWSRHRKP